MCFKKITNWLDKYYCQAEKERIKELEGEVAVLEIELDKHKPKEVTLPPELELYPLAYRGQRWIYNKKGYRTNAKLKPSEYYLITDHLNEVVAGAQIEVEDSDEERFRKVLYWIQENIKYEIDGTLYDRVEYLAFPFETLKLRRADCECMTRLLLTVLMYLRVPTDKVFTAQGFLKSGSSKVGHAYPIFRYNDGSYLVGEPTLSEKTAPLPLEAVEKFYDASWGLHNWTWDGLQFIKEKRWWLNTAGNPKYKINHTDATSEDEKKKKLKMLDKIWSD